MDFDKATYKDLGERLHQISKMKADGLFLDCSPPTDSEMKWFMLLVAKIGAGAPFVYITPEAELFAQWNFERYDIDGYFDFANKRIQLEVYTKDVDFIVEANYGFSELDLAQRIGEFLIIYY